MLKKDLRETASRLSTHGLPMNQLSRMIALKHMGWVISNIRFRSETNSGRLILDNALLTVNPEIC